MYLIVSGANKIAGFDRFWLALALVADLASYGTSAYGKRNRIPV
jgi:hypothetical protein